MKISMRVAAICLAALLALAPRPGAAMGSCSGVLSATLLSPLPAPLVLRVPLMDDSPRNIDLANRFKRGLQKSGVSIAGTPTAVLTTYVTTLGPDRDGGAPGRGQDNSFNWMSGGLDPSLPGESRLGGSRPAPGPTTLILRAEIRRTPADRVAWTATLQCMENGDDQRVLAYDIGKVIGAAVGQRVDRRRF